VSPPTPRPKFFIDRSLGRIAVLRRFTANKKAIFGATATPGPYIYSVQQDRLDLLYPKRSRRNVSDIPSAEV
jgi:hypothetical protein